MSRGMVHRECRNRFVRARIATGLCLVIGTSTLEAAPNHFEYISPVPGASMVALGNNIVIRDGRPIDRSSFEGRARVVVVGSTSGLHPGRLILSDDSKTLVFTPQTSYASGEEITVRLEPGVTTSGQASLPPLEFTFKTTTLSPERSAALARRDAPDECFAPPGSPIPGPGLRREAAELPPQPSALPADYPSISLVSSNDPDPGNVFITPFNYLLPPRGRLAVLDNYGMPLFYRSGPTWAFDLKMQNGFLTYLIYFKAFALDSTYAAVDSFETGNGYRTDVHDFQWLPNHHALLMAYDPEPVRMDLVVPGGNPNAIVTGLIVQELDAAKNVVFQWRSWDHFSILDASVSGLVSLTDSLIDYVHGNAVELDKDGNLLISCRHMDEITKINRSTGVVMWRLGLNAANNQFTFVNDSRGFSHQHDIRRLPNGNITLFDNGNFLDPQYSSALEYRLNEHSHRATLVWQYQNDPLLFGGFMGNVQRHANGGTMIGWGGTSGIGVTELHSDGTKAYELAFQPNWVSYRAYRFPWRTSALITSKQSLNFGRVVVGGRLELPLTVRNNTTAPITITSLVSTDAIFASPTSVPFTLTPGQTKPLSVAFSPPASGVFAANFYLQSVSATALLAQVVQLTGSADATTGTSAESPASTMLDAVIVRGGGPIEIHFAVGESRDPVRLEIFDARGSLVRVLDQSVRDPGNYMLPWDRCDARGRAVSRGVYFVQLTSTGYRAAKKLTLVH